MDALIMAEVDLRDIEVEDGVMTITGRASRICLRPRKPSNS